MSILDSSNCFGLDGIDSFTDLQFSYLFQAFEDRSTGSKYNWYRLHLQVPRLDSDIFQLLTFFYSHSMIYWNDEIH